MIVAGGTYIEECVAPRAIALLGSGGRAALALRDLATVEFHTFYPDPEEITANFGTRAVTHASSAQVKFHYLHPLARPQIDLSEITETAPVHIAGDLVLRFGCLEGDFVVEASQAVYDPQGSGVAFRANGSSAHRLAIVLNESEARRLVGEDDVLKAGSAILRLEAAEAVVIKRGAAGALVFCDNARSCAIPAFRTSVVHKIGSGDIFSAMFAYYWSKNLPIEEAATLASRQTADYAQTRIVQRPAEPPIFGPVSANPEQLSVLLVADGESTCTLWLLDEASRALSELGVREVLIADRHLGRPNADWLENCDVVLALPQAKNGFAAAISRLAKSRGVSCVVFVEEQSTANAFARDGLSVVQDFSASIYSAIWVPT